MVDYLLRGDSGLRPVPDAPRFSAGRTVMVGDPPAADHTRLPGYLRNKTGTISAVYPGAYNYFVSTGPVGIGEPMPVYRVAFEATHIWGSELCEPHTTIYADLYEVYLQTPNA